MSETQPTRITHDDWTIAWTERRPASPTETPPLLVIHGIGDSSIHTFQPLFGLPPLAGEHAIFLDLPGFGFSSAEVTWPATMDDYADAVLRAMDDLGLERARVFGHSLGGSVAIEMATKQPERFPLLIAAEALLVPENSVLANSIARRSEDAFAERGLEMLQRATRQQAARGDEASRKFAPTLDMSSPRIMHRVATSLVEERTPSYEDMLCALPMPRGFIIGERTDADTSRIESAGVQLRRVPDAGHAMMSENPEAFADTLAELLSTVSANEYA